MKNIKIWGKTNLCLLSLKFRLFFVQGSPAWLVTRKCVKNITHLSLLEAKNKRFNKGITSGVFH